MKRTPLIAVAIVAVLLTPVAEALALSWKETKDTHFIVYYTKDDEKFAKEVLKKAEGYYKSIPRKLGITRYSSFWTWDNRVKIYIHSDRATFLLKTKRKEWVRAIANYKTREIISYKDEKATPFLNTTLPHELTHLALRDFLEFKNKAIPLWLDEGVAQIMEKGRVDQAEWAVKNLLKTADFMSVSTLAKLDPRRVRDRRIVSAFYNEACALVSFMIEEHGDKNFLRFCEGLRDGKTVNQALQSAYPTTISSEDKLNDAWKKYLLKGVVK